MHRPDLFATTDFRAWLRDWFAWRKEQDPLWSYQLLSEQAGLKSRSHFFDVTQGRTLTARFLPAYIRLLELGAEEEAYFRALVAYDLAGDPSAQARCFRAVVAANPELDTLRMDGAYAELFSHWRHIALLTLAEMHPKERDPAALGRMLEPAQAAGPVQASLDLLAHHGLLRADPRTGRWRLGKRFLSCSDRHRPQALRPFHLQMMELGRRAYEKDVTGQHFSTLTLGTTRTAQQKIEALLARTRADILDIVKGEPGAEVVLQFNLQLFELTRSQKRTRTEAGR